MDMDVDMNLDMLYRVEFGNSERGGPEEGGVLDRRQDSLRERGAVIDGWESVKQQPLWGWDFRYP